MGSRGGFLMRRRDEEGEERSLGGGGASETLTTAQGSPCLAAFDVVFVGDGVGRVVLFHL
jgi:hypothetical protein